MSAVDLVILERVKWDWFVSCTVKRRDASDIYLTKKCFALLRWLARQNSVCFPRLPWALRIESGVSPDHRHFHCLIGGLLHTGISMRMAAINRWCYMVGTKNPENPKGTCRVRLYDGSRGAACYLTSALNAAEYRGWSESYLRISHAAMWLANHAVHNNVAGIGAYRRS